MNRIAIIGGGPAALFMYKRLIEEPEPDFTIDIFEATSTLGSGMPYSYAGARHGFHDYKVIPRLLFGEYLSDQFYLLKKQADASSLVSAIHINSAVTDITDNAVSGKVIVAINQSVTYEFDKVIICTEHHWPKTYEGKVNGYFDSPYPPAKLKLPINYPVDIRGSSLTAIGAIRTLSRNNGQFVRNENKILEYISHKSAGQFSITMHSRHEAIRFHLEDPRLKGHSLLTKEQLDEHRRNNDGFLSLDYIFEKDFKDSFIGKDNLFHGFIKNLALEDFVHAVMSMWERQDAFELFEKEYNRAAQSIRLKQSIYWKELLAVLSFAINYPAKYFSAEDMLRLQKILKPLIAVSLLSCHRSLLKNYWHCMQRVH